VRVIGHEDWAVCHCFWRSTGIPLTTSRQSRAPGATQGGVPAGVSCSCGSATPTFFRRHGRKWLRLFRKNGGATRRSLGTRIIPRGCKHPPYELERSTYRANSSSSLPKPPERIGKRHQVLGSRFSSSR
jgi:hypothetical protein